jgi:hypothetical protein
LRKPFDGLTFMADTLELEAELTADGSLYPRLLSRAARKWFVTKIVAHSSGAADIPAKSKQYLQQAKSIADVEPPPHEYKVPGSQLYILHIYPHIIYASLGTYPAVFLDQPNSALLEFVTERRLRTILQMRDRVNDPDRFDFPADILHSTLRPTQTHWEGVNEVGNEKLWPFVLKQGAAVDRKEAVEELFKPPPASPADLNAVDCQTAASMVLLDSLLEAHDPKKLFDQLDQAGSGYLAIDNPDGAVRLSNGELVGGLYILDEAVTTGNNVVLKVIPPVVAEAPFDVVLLDATGATETVTISDVKNPSVTQLLAPGVPATPENIAKAMVRTAAVPALPSKLTAESLQSSYARGTRVRPQGVPPFHFLSDPHPQSSLFEQGLLPIEELQPGDVVHVLGHPLTREKVPASPFAGERCVIVYPWALTTYLILVTGHGVDVLSLNDLALEALIEPNRLLTVARQVLNNCLSLPMDDIAIKKGTSDDAHVDIAKIPPDDGVSIAEIIGRGLAVNQSVWSKPGFYTHGTWEIHDLPAIAKDDLDWWARIDEDPLDKFPGYPEQWALAVKGRLDLGPEGVLELTAGDLFVFGYWPDNPDDSALTWDTIVNHNFVGLLRKPVHNTNSTDPSLQYVIPYRDDQAGFLVTMPLYDEVTDDRPIPTVLTYSDLASQLFNIAKDDGEAWVLRPRVSADPGYLTFLRTIGALPATP